MAVTLTPELALALETGVKEALKTAFDKNVDPRDLVAPDSTIEDLTMNVTVHMDALTFGHDTDKAPTCSIPMLPVLALMVRRMGATREDALKTIREVMEEALTLGKDATETLLSESGVADAERAIKEEVIAKLPLTLVRKTIKAKGVNLEVQVVSSKPTAV